MEMMAIKAFTVIVLLVGVYGFGYFSGIQKLNEYKAEQQTIALIQEGRAIALEREVKEIKDETVKDYNQRIAAIREYYSKRMHDADSSQVSGVSQPAGGIDEISPDALALAGQCAETTQQLTALQEWLERVKEAADKIAADKAGH